MASVSEKLRARLEDEFNIIIPKPINRVHGAKGAALRWDCYDSNGHHYISEDSMADCLKAERLARMTCTKDIGVVYHVGPN